jgi:hypothetical protein
MYEDQCAFCTLGKIGGKAVSMFLHWSHLFEIANSI